MNILKSVKNCSNAKLIGAIALTGVLGSLVGAFAMNEYNYRVDRPKYAVYGHHETMWDLTSQVDGVYEKSDKRYDIAYEYLSLKGSSIAYHQRIARLRDKAFQASKLTHKHYDEAAIDAVDTRAGDALLLEAMDHLSDNDLYWVLMVKSSLFDQSSRANIRSRLERNDYTYPIERYSDLLTLHSSLSEFERSKIQDCYKKLEEWRKGASIDEALTQAGMCSEKTAYRPYVMWGGYSESLYKRFKRSIGLLDE